MGAWGEEEVKEVVASASPVRSPESVVSERRAERVKGLGEGEGGRVRRGWGELPPWMGRETVLLSGGRKVEKLSKILTKYNTMYSCVQ